MFTAAILIAGAVFLAALLFCEKFKPGPPLVTTKSILSILFVITAFIQPRPVPRYFEWLFAGLVMCLIGDVLLALPQKRAFIAGLAAFLLGHVCYISSFFTLTLLDDWFSPAIVVFVPAGFFVYGRLRPHLGSLAVPVVLYLIVITVMVIGAWAVVRTPEIQLWGKITVCGGAVCFYVSDIFVARDKFIKSSYGNRLAGLPLYYGGQFMLAFSVGLLLK